MSLFLVGALFAAFAYYQWRLDTAGWMFNDRPSVPLLVLSFGPWIQAAVLTMVLHALRETSPKEQLFPRLFGQAFTSRPSEFLWEKVSALVVVVLPLLAFGYFWTRFFSPRHAVWNTETGAAVDRFQMVSPLLMWRHWDDHRFGDIAGKVGSSFVPFWQPVLIMGGGLLLVLVLSGLVGARVARRWPVRRNRVRQP